MDVQALKNEVSDILRRALAGYNTDFKYPSEGTVFIRWGEVEKAIHKTIDHHLTGQPNSERTRTTGTP